MQLYHHFSAGPILFILCKTNASPHRFTSLKPCMMRPIQQCMALLLALAFAGCGKEDMVPATTASLRILNNSSDPFAFQMRSSSMPSTPAQSVAALRNTELVAAIGDSLRISGSFAATHAQLALGGQSTASFDTTIMLQAGLNELQVIPSPRKYWGLKLVNAVTRPDYSQLDLAYELNGQTIYAPLMRSPLHTGQPGGMGCVTWFAVDSTRNWRNLRVFYTYTVPGVTGFTAQRSFPVFSNAPQPHDVFPPGQANYYTVNVTD